MKNISSSTKTVLIFIGILIIGGILYFYTLGGASDANISSLDQQAVIGNADTQIVGARVLSLLVQINSLKIDKTLFDDPLYKTLQDHTVSIPEENIGRANPFAPFYSVPTPAITPLVPVVKKK